MPWWLFFIDLLVDLLQWLTILAPILAPLFKPIVKFLRWIGSDGPETFQPEEGVMEPIEDPRFKQEKIKCSEQSEGASL
tara:strand:- start:9804 stop:10040 length:237 start_codon:yes stop_codon:yes gene_type:complete